MKNYVIKEIVGGPLKPVVQFGGKTFPRGSAALAFLIDAFKGQQVMYEPDPANPGCFDVLVGPAMQQYAIEAVE